MNAAGYQPSYDTATTKGRVTRIIADAPAPPAAVTRIIADAPAPPAAAVLDETEAAVYVRHRKILLDLIARGYLKPLTTGRRNLTFHRRAIDIALTCAAEAGPNWQQGLPKLVSVEVAMSYYKEKSKKNS